MKSPSRALLAAALALVSACEPADDVKVQPLPSLERASPEARAGLPEVAGAWRFAGWELAEGDSAGLERDLPGFGVLWLRSQQRDSVGGAYVMQGGRVPLFGEVRRDSVVSLVSLMGPGDGRFLAGRVSRDTLWMELTSLLEPGSWPTGARAAFVRTAVSAPFVRIHGAPPALAQVDSLAADSLAALARTDSGAAARPAAPGIAPAAPPTVPPAAQRTAPAPAQRAPTQAAPAQPRPQPPVRQPAAPRPAPAQPRPRPAPDVPLLGEPVPDTSRVRG